MRMSEFIVREAISANLSANQKEAVIREMVDNLRLAGYFKGNEAEDVVKALNGIRNAINNVSEFVASTAAAVEEQNVVTGDMSSNMQRAASELAA